MNILRHNKIYDIMAKKYEPKTKSIEEQICEDVDKIADKIGVNYATYLSAAFHLCEEISWRYYERLSRKYKELVRHNSLTNEEMAHFKNLIRAMDMTNKGFHQYRQQTMGSDSDNYVDAMATKMLDGYSREFFILEFSARNEVLAHLPEDHLIDVRKYALMMLVMIDLAYDMYDYCENKFREADPSYHFMLAGEIMRGKTLDKIRQCTELICQGMDIDKALSGHLKTSRKVFKNKIIWEIQHNIETEGGNYGK